MGCSTSSLSKIKPEPNDFKQVSVGVGVIQVAVNCNLEIACTKKPSNIENSIQPNAQKNIDDPVTIQIARRNRMDNQINIQNNEYKTIHNYTTINQDKDGDVGVQSDNQRQNSREHANSINRSQFDRMNENLKTNKIDSLRNKFFDGDSGDVKT